MRHICCVFLVILTCAVANADTPKQLRQKAEAGDSDAQYWLAQSLESGSESARDVAAAVQWYERAAGRGNSKAMLRLGVLNYNGNVHGDAIPADTQAAWLWFTFAAAYGEPTAAEQADTISGELRPAILRDLQLRAADSLMSGKMVPSNIEKAIELYRTAATSGSMEAAEVLGRLCGEGVRVPPNLAEATRWWEKALELGSPKATYSLGRIAESGSPPNFVRALELYRTAAQRVDTDSICRIGEMYADGIGVPRDPVLADAWLTVAAYFDVKKAKAALQDLEPKLSADQLRQAHGEAGRMLDSIGQVHSATK